jgi:hypothetical protein
VWSARGLRTFVRTTLLVADFIPATKAGGGGVGGSGLWNCLSGTWTLGQLSKCHLDTRTAVRVALGHSDNCPSGTQTLGQLSELHLDTRTAVRVTLKHLYSRPKYFGQGPKWFARACASRWLDNSKRRDVKRTEASLHGLLFRQVHKPIPSRRRALTAVVRGLVRAESGLGSGLGREAAATAEAATAEAARGVAMETAGSTAAAAACGWQRTLDFGHV